MMCVINALKSNAATHNLDVLSDANASAVENVSVADKKSSVFKGFYTAMQPNSHANHQMRKAICQALLKIQGELFPKQSKGRSF